MKSLGTIWVCMCCMLSHANGECCASDEHGGDSRGPLSLVTDDVDVTMGLLSEEHDSECEVFKTGEHSDNEECECDRITFSSSRCEGCGSSLAGERHALTMWKRERS